MESAVRVKLLVPLLVRVTDCAPLVAPTTWLPKVRLEELSETPGAVPVPVKAIVCVPPEALSVIVTVPLRVPVVVGVNVTAITQVPLATTGVATEQVVEASSA